MSTYSKRRSWWCRLFVCVVPCVDGCRWQRDSRSKRHSRQIVDRVISARHSTTAHHVYRCRTLPVSCVLFCSPTPTMSVCVGGIFESVCLSVCLQHNSRTDDPKVFKLGIGNNLGMDILQVTWCWVKRSNVKVMVMVNSNTAWVWTRWVLSIFVHSLTEIQRSAGVLKTLVEQCLLILCTNPDFRL